MPVSDADREVYLAWYHSTHVADPTYGRAIDPALTEYRDAYHEFINTETIDPESGTFVWRRITKSTRELFHETNVSVNRWPMSIRAEINRRHSRSSAITDENQPSPFHTWAQPRFVERRKQAVSTWLTLLHFLKYNWSEYGGINGTLHSLGLEPTHECCDIIDDLRLYAMLPHKFKPASAAVDEKVAEFFLLILRDPDPIPRSNPQSSYLRRLLRDSQEDFHHLVRSLKTEIEYEDGDEEEDFDLDTFHEMYSLEDRNQHDPYLVVQWDTSEQADGLLASRVIYVNEMAKVDDVKATGWAERQR